METTFYITKNTQTGKNDLITEHLFCRDIWKEIKSFLFYPIDVARGLPNISKFFDEGSRDQDQPAIFVLAGIRRALREEAWRVPRGTKALKKLLENSRSNQHPFDLATGECLIKGLNVELYRYWERKTIERTKEDYRKDFISRKKCLTQILAPFHSPKGGWCSYATGIVIYERTLENYYLPRYGGATTRQEAIIAFEKQSRLKYISVAMYKAFLFKKKIPLAGMTIREFLGMLMKHSSLDKGTLFAIGGIPFSWNFIDTL